MELLVVGGGGRRGGLDKLRKIHCHLRESSVGITYSPFFSMAERRMEKEGMLLKLVVSFSIQRRRISARQHLSLL